MELPFTAEQFFEVFRAYNESVWPAQWVLNILAVVALSLVLRPRYWSGRAISAILGGLWLWTGLAYQLAFFTAINPLAYVFAVMSVAGGGAFLWFGAVQQRLQFRWCWHGRGVMGLLLVIFALIVYPSWSLLAGHPYPEFPTFGLPCPTTIFTIGLLAFLASPYPRAILIVPVLWCLVGAQAAFLLGVPADLGLLVAAALGVFLFCSDSGTAQSLTSS